MCSITLPYFPPRHHSLALNMAVTVYPLISGLDCTGMRDERARIPVAPAPENLLTTLYLIVHTAEAPCSPQPVGFFFAYNNFCI